MRQQGPEQARFREVLENVRIDRITTADWTLLQSRVAAHLPAAEVATFNNALRIYATKAEVNELNYRSLRDLRRPAVVVEADHEGER